MNAPLHIFPLHVLTRNNTKRKAAQQIFDSYTIPYLFCDNEFPEIQAATSAEIARYTALQAVRELQVPVVREDHSFFIDALGMPGPYMAYIEKKLSASLLLQLLSLLPVRTGRFELALAYATPEGKLLEFTSTVPVHFTSNIKVPCPYGGWDGIIALEGDTRAFSEYPEEERMHVWQGNFLQLAQVLHRS